MYATNQEILLDAIRNLVTALNTSSDAGNTSLGTIDTSLGTLNTSVNTSSSNLFERQSASSGFKQISGNQSHVSDAGTYFAVQFVTECTITTFACTNSDTINNVTYPAGLVIYGDIYAITGSADNVYILYKQ